MKLSEELIEFIHSPVSMYLGTRNEALLPQIIKVIGGAIVESDRETITLYVLEAQSAVTLHNLEHNGKVAFTVSAPSHETYQFKGTFIASRPSESKDIAIQDVYMAKLRTFLKMVYFPEAIFETNAFKPNIAISFKVEEVYDQTPGPGAGKLKSEN